MRLVVCRLGLHWPDTMADGECECVVCGDVSERRLRIPLPRIRLRWPLARRSRLDEALYEVCIVNRQFETVSAALSRSADRIARLSQDAAAARRRLDRAEQRAGAVDVLIRRLSGIEAKRETDGAGGGQAEVVVVFPALPDPFDADAVAERLARELAPHLREPGYWKRTCDFFTETRR